MDAIKLFIEKAELLADCSLLKNTPQFGTKIKWVADEGEAVQQTSPPRESIESLGMRIRPFLVSSEPIFFKKIITKLVENELIATNKEVYQKYDRTFDELLKTSGLVIKINENDVTKEFTDNDMIWQYLYADYFHLDESKRRIIKDSSIIGSFAETMALTKLIKFASLIVNLSNQIKQFYSNQ